MAENNIIFCTLFFFIFYLYSFRFHFFSLWYFSMQILCSCSCTPLAAVLLGAVAEILMCRDYELRNRPGRPPPPPPRSPLFTHAYWWDAIHIFLYILYASPIPRIIHDAPHFPSHITVYNMVFHAPPSTHHVHVYLWCTYII